MSNNDIYHMCKICGVLSMLLLLAYSALVRADSTLLKEESAALGDGYYESEWLGTFFADDSGWVYQTGLGWLYCSPTAVSNEIWFYSLDLGWILTGSNVFPAIYSDGSKAWIYFSDESDGMPLFYNFSGEYFFELGAPDEPTQIVSEGDLITRFHEVSGTVQVLGNGVVEISGFNFDGAGIDVRAVISTNANYDNFTVLTGDLLLDGGYSGTTQRLFLPDGFSPDQVLYISIWCIPVRISFGDVVLVP